MGDPLQRTVHLPLRRLDQCSVCAKKTTLRLCSGCSERIYCSKECQTSDWKTHKRQCRSAEFIELPSFYPFLAALAERFRLDPIRTSPAFLHPALKKQIVNEDVNPLSSPTRFPDGEPARLLVLGPEMDMTQPAPDLGWAIHADTPMIESKLRRRILREGDALPILTALCVALLGTIYATSSKTAASANPKDAWQTRGPTRLRYRSSPVADFGICMGSARVTSQDKLAYLDLDTLTLTKGQDPANHIWLYFQTLKGEDVYLDLCMFTFNMCMLTSTEPYTPGLPIPFAPAYFRDRVLARGVPFELHAERDRVSALRSQALHRVVASCATEMQGNDLAEFMRAVSGRKPSLREVDLAAQFAMLGLRITENMLACAGWKSFPKEAEINIERDPNEDDSPVRVTAAQREKMRRRWTRLYEKGLITKEHLGTLERDYVVE